MDTNSRRFIKLRCSLFIQLLCSSSCPDQSSNFQDVPLAYADNNKFFAHQIIVRSASITSRLSSEYEFQDQCSVLGGISDRVYICLGSGGYSQPQSLHQKQCHHCRILLHPWLTRSTPLPPYFLCSLSPSLPSISTASTPRASREREKRIANALPVTRQPWPVTLLQCLLPQVHHHQLHQ